MRIRPIFHSIQREEGGILDASLIFITHMMLA